MSEPRTSRGHDVRASRLGDFVEITLEMLRDREIACTVLFSQIDADDTLREEARTTMP